jgi:7-cyano-7-deazaguanine synthase
MLGAEGPPVNRGGEQRSREVVLLSGGLDSACVLAERVEVGAEPIALFIDYGQPAAAIERSASRRLAEHFGAARGEVGVEGIELPAGEIAGRNALLVHLALTWLGNGGARTIYLGIHAGTGYRDCSPEFLEETQRSLDFQSGGAARLVAPFVNWPKELVVARALKLGVPVDMTHSCERAEIPCGECLSCIDRRNLLASA